MKKTASRIHSAKVTRKPKKSLASPLTADGIDERIAILDELRDSPVLTAIWPEVAERPSLAEAVRLSGDGIGADDFDRAFRAAKSHRHLLKCPILAVLGQLNAGKSSVVASFLSEAGRKRLPRGTENRYGTHRFVYWVPSDWMRDETTRNAFVNLLASVHGKNAEFLSTDPAEAEEQYRSGRDDLKKMQIPLIADDPALDEFEAAFLDCPDVQTKDRQAGASDDTNPRLDFIGSAARACSAFLLVWDRSQVRDNLLSLFLETIRERMAGVPLYLLLNMITPEIGQPTLTRNDSDLMQKLGQFNIGKNACYGAFNFKIGPQDGEPGWKELTPPKLVESFDEMVSRFGREARFPQFYCLDLEEDRNIATAVEPARFLTNLPGQLSGAQLQTQKLQDHWAELSLLGEASLSTVSQYVDECINHVDQIHAGLLDFCLALFTKNGEPQQVPSEAFDKALGESLVRTAPGPLKLVLRFQEGFQRTLRAAKQRIAVLPISDWIKNLRSEQRKVGEGLRDLGIENGILHDPESLAHEMHTCRWVPETIEESRLESGWRQVLQRFQKTKDKVVEVDPKRFDEMTRGIWKSMTTWQKVKLALKHVVGLIAIILAFGGIVTALIDGGATLFASYSLTATISTAIPGVPMLGFAAAAAAGGAVWSFMLGAVTLNTLPLLSLFFSLACDAFGVPRRVHDRPLKVRFAQKINNGRKRPIELHLPDVDLKPSSPACPLGRLRLWKKAPAIEKYQEVFGDE